MKISNLNEVIDILRPKLPLYLESQGIDPAKKFKCFSPNHDDQSPSARIDTHQNSEYVKCFGCGQTFDIFASATCLESLPTQGADWIVGNVLILAERYKVEVNMAELTEREKYIAAIQRAYGEASCVVSDLDTGTWAQDVETYISSRKWTKDFLSNKGAGVSSREEVLNYMLQAGYTPEYLREINLITDEAPVIEENRLIFTIYDHMDKAIGFAARTFGEKSKYINTTSAGLLFDMPKKGDILYGMNVAKKFAKKQPLYIFEGYGDVLSANAAGMENCVAIMGTSLTEAQVNLIQRLGFNSIVLSLDFDDPGVKATASILENLKDVRDLYISVVNQLANSKSDPGEYIEQHGLEAYKKLGTSSAFKWFLDYKISKGTSGSELAKAMVGIIASEPNAITREIQIKDLSKSTDVSIHALDMEITKVLNKNLNQLETAEKLILNHAYTEMDRHPDERLSILTKTVNSIEEARSEHTAGKFSNRSCIALLEDVRRQGDEADPDAVVGFRLPLLPQIAECFSGGKDWAVDTLMMLGGPENAGKSSYMAFKALNVASVEENDAIAIYFSIDDSAGDMLPKFIAGSNCILDGEIATDPERELLIGAIINPHNWLQTRKLTTAQQSSIEKRRDAAYEYVKSLMVNERLIVKDASDGSNLDYLEATVRYYRSRYPSKRIFAVLDNTHNLSDFSGGNMEARDRYTRIADRMNTITNRYHICLLTSVEYRKQMSGVKRGNKVLPSNDDIAEARAFKYRAKWIGHIYNDMHTKPQDYDTFHVHPHTLTHLPRILLLHGKTKINGVKGLVSVLDFFPGQSAFRWVNESVAKVEAKRFLESRKNDGISDSEGDKDEDW